MANGILIIDKPKDWTSHDVVAKLRGVFHEKRIGHAGTLDPMATGVLPIFMGRATRAVEFASQGDKEYTAVIRLGLVTDTQDITGNTLQSNPVYYTSEQLSAILPQFQGCIEQIPPMYSAIKKDGKKLYELARAGKEVERKPRPVTIYSLDLVTQLSSTDFVLKIKCSKGTYIRTLCHDIGAILGGGGCLYSLRRTNASNFNIDDSVPLLSLLSSTNPSEYLSAVDTLFSEHPSLTVNIEQEKKIRNGAQFPITASNGIYRVYSQSNDFLMLGRAENNNMITIKSFFEVS